MGAPNRRAAKNPAPASKGEVKIPFKERAVTHAIVGASLGTMAGERLGEISFVGAASYAGYAIGTATGNSELGGLIGGVAGAGAGYFVERKVGIGKTVGGSVGFLSGGIVGGISGTVVGGIAALANLF